MVQSGIFLKWPRTLSHRRTERIDRISNRYLYEQNQKLENCPQAVDNGRPISKVGAKTENLLRSK
jgi:hypothetical protein